MNEWQTLLFGNPQILDLLTGSHALIFWVVLFFAAGFAGFVDAMAGGGGMIILPVLLATGFPPHLALGTSKLQASFGAVTAAYHYRKGGFVQFRKLWLGVLATAIGAVIGTFTVGRIDGQALKFLIPLLLAGILIFMVIRPRFGLDPGPARIKAPVFWVVAGLLLGFYDGFFGPGTGSFWAMGLVAFAGMELAGATAHTKVVNATSNLVSLVVFLLAGTVAILPGLIMGAAQIIGAWQGSRMVMKRGASFVRIVLLSATALMTGWLVIRYIVHL